MVDLAKIRKKAKKKPDEAEAATATTPEPASEAIARSGAIAEPSETPRGAAPGAAMPAEAGSETAAAPPQSPADAAPQLSKLEAFKEQAGKRRSSEIARTETHSADQRELLTCIIAGEQYAVDIERIVEIVTPRAVTRIPNADASIVGIISLRGTIVTLVDVRGKLRHPPAGEPTPDTRIVVIDFHNEMIGFVVDRVLRVVKTENAGIEPHPVVHANELDDSIRGVFRANGALTILLDLDKLLDHRWI
ncbi:MAG TPA: chemotaxis protein CheW [Thermoanaerobaculia bacterium]|nr:chemotaxis protein CheW [Thermoanaerobaculia bacterium]